MIENLVDFSLTTAAGAAALFCLFEGTRRLGAHGVHRKALLLILFAGGTCAAFGGFAYKRYADLRSTLAESQPKPPAKTAASWNKAASPEKKEQLSQALARQTFKASGTLRLYVDHNGES